VQWTARGVTVAKVKLSAIDLNILVALNALLAERNVTRAAARVGRSQPAMSHALNRARDLFQDPLLVRVRGGLELSARARIIAPKLHRLLRELGAVLDTHQSFDPSSIECVTIGATDYVGFVLLPHLLSLVRDAAPRASVRIHAVEGPEALDPLDGGVLDVAVGAFPQVPAGLRTEELFQDDFVCLRRRQPKARKPRSSVMSLDEFANAGHVLVASPGSGMGPVDYALARRGRSRHVAAHVPHFLVAPSIVARTDLVVTTGRRIARQLAPTLGLEAFEAPLALEPFVVRMVWHPRTDDDSVGRWLRGLLRQASTEMTKAEQRGPSRRKKRS
jgi:DNA-binding transcriptional LysR family regulator